MNLTPESRAALHELLDISLNTPREVATVMFGSSAHCGVITVDIHLGGWKEGVGATRSWWIILDGTNLPEKALAEVREYLSQDNMADILAAKRADKVALLKSELAQLEAAV